MALILCKRCQREKQHDHFSPDRDSATGRVTMCKKCHRDKWANKIDWKAINNELLRGWVR